MTNTEENERPIDKVEKKQGKMKKEIFFKRRIYFISILGSEQKKRIIIAKFIINFPASFLKFLIIALSDSFSFSFNFFHYVCFV